MEDARTSAHSHIVSVCTFECPCTRLNADIDCGGEIAFSVAVDVLDNHVKIITARVTHPADVY